MRLLFTQHCRARATCAPDHGKVILKSILVCDVLLNEACMVGTVHFDYRDQYLQVRYLSAPPSRSWVGVMSHRKELRVNNVREGSQKRLRESLAVVPAVDETVPELGAGTQRRRDAAFVDLAGTAEETEEFFAVGDGVRKAEGDGPMWPSTAMSACE